MELPEDAQQGRGALGARQVRCRDGAAGQAVGAHGTGTRGAVGEPTEQQGRDDGDRREDERCAQ
jgi:hypothetical protein